MKIYISICFVAVILFSSCRTVLNSGNFTLDVISPPPMKSGSGSTTVPFIRGAYGPLNKSEFQRNWLVQAGLIQALKIGSRMATFDIYFGLSGFYGMTKLTNEENLIFSPSIDLPISFFGGSFQSGMSSGIHMGDVCILDIGCFGQIAYEAGPYRDFRLQAKNLFPSSSIHDKVVEDTCPSGWSGILGHEIGFTAVLQKNLLLRVGTKLGCGASDILSFFSSPDGKKKMRVFFYELDTALRIKNIIFGISVNGDIHSFFLSRVRIALSLGFAFDNK